MFAKKQSSTSANGGFRAREVESQVYHQCHTLLDCEEVAEEGEVEEAASTSTPNSTLSKVTLLGEAEAHSQTPQMSGGNEASSVLQLEAKVALVSGTLKKHLVLGFSNKSMLKSAYHGDGNRKHCYACHDMGRHEAC